MVAQDGIKMRGAGPGRELETANEFQALLNANRVGRYCGGYREGSRGSVPSRSTGSWKTKLPVDFLGQL